MRHRRFLGLFAVLLLAAAVQSQCGCAVPVRPVAFLEQDKGGRWHFVPDEAQEPQLSGFVAILTPLISALGPWGTAIAAAASVVLPTYGGMKLGAHRERKRRPPTAPAHAPIPT